jgi:hypothetical protein
MGGSGIDIRVPIGLMFLVVGVIIGGYGIATNGDSMYANHSLGYNINLIWGAVLVVFSLLMLGLAWMGAKKPKR